MEDKPKDTSKLGKYLGIYMAKFQKETLLAAKGGLRLDIFRPLKLLGSGYTSIWQAILGKRE